jgi:hypothetical protein
MLIELTREEIERLYHAPGLEHYRPEAVLAHTDDGIAVPALCYNLLQAPEANERNPDYARRLKGVLTKLGFPADYVASIE